MQVLHKFTSGSKKSLGSSDRFSIFYHNLFTYPLTFSELARWTSKNPPDTPVKVGFRDGFYFIDGSARYIYERAIRHRFSQKKIKIAKKAAKVLSYIPAVKMIGLSGSVAMDNAEKGSDIDLIIVTKRGSLWTTRLVVYGVLNFLRYRLRIPRNLKQKDKLCLNIWLDESDLTWSKKERNFYTAHEILQVIPLVSKDKTFERFLSVNKWAFDYWPNAVSSRKINIINTSYSKLRNPNLIELIAYKIQYLYMKKKITREIVKPTRAIFHPNNLSKSILSKIGN
jgi:predicted nucleotidyltransferase